jgi:serine phosphatase RsbU (regulator of sigma subunit)
MWFRPEVLRQVTWGGDPRAGKVVAAEEGRLTLSPRHSFEAWSETVARTATRWAPHEVDTATGFAQHLSDSMLRQVERTSRLATALQQTLLLNKPPDLPQLDVAFGYAPHLDDVVGGDWYDVVPLASGRTGVVLGDVAGHGLAASAISAQMRNALRAHLLSTEDPALALGRLNALVAALLPGELATAVVAVVDAGTGQVDVASAGHPPPVHLDPAGRASLVHGGTRGPALGLLDAASYTSSRLELEPGGVVLLYSDGLVEDRAADWEVRMEALLSAAGGPVADLGALCDRLIDTVSSRADDTTVLALRSTRTP